VDLLPEAIILRVLVLQQQPTYSVSTSLALLFFFRFFCAFNASTVIVLIGASFPENFVTFDGLVSLDNGCENGLVGDNGEREVTDGLGLSCGVLELSLGRVVDFTLLWLALTFGEENELVLVAVKSIHVQLELMFTGVVTSVINSNSDGVAEFGAQFGGSKFLESEASSVANLTGVLAGSR